MAPTNHQRVNKAMELLRQGLQPFVEREMEATYGADWAQEATRSLRRHADWRDGEPHLDIQALLVIMWDHWNSVFRNTLGHSERSWVSELRDMRNQWAHQAAFSTDDTYRVLDTATLLLRAIAAPEAQALERHKYELLRLRFAEQSRRERRKAAAIEGQPAAGLLPWREIVTPHPDVASGRYQQAEFAADLAAVERGDPQAGEEYSEPRQFFQRTFLTQGLRYLLRTALQRLNGTGGDPVIELQTNFGGGKTHSMLALYHLVSGRPANELPGIEPLMKEVELDGLPQARRAVLVGTAFSPAIPHHHADGIVTHTLWGEMAWQLGGAAGYQIIAEADRAGVSPGSQQLVELFRQVGPALILIDEWVAYIRQLYDKSGLPAGSFDANLTFAQALTEAVKLAPTTLLVASLPASDIEIGGEAGKEALARLHNTFGRVESAWRPASTEEGFEIVRRRLFQPISEEAHFIARDTVLDAFAHLYREQAQEFPDQTRDGYRARLESAYPIHPELFDRLYADWSSLERFQRTRGVLRLMAAVIHALWERGDKELLILPASVPLDDNTVHAELMRYLDDPWSPVMERDVDGPDSLPQHLDEEISHLGRYSAARRVARTLFMGSAPTAKSRNPGLDERHVKLGCTQPGESVATFGDALRRLTDQATHLYVDRSRYWFSTQPSVTRLAQERASQLDEALVWAELRRRLQAERARGELAAVHPLPASSADVPDEQRARLVILGHEATHSSRQENSPARAIIAEMLASRGNAPRLYKNTLVFLAPDTRHLGDLEEALRLFLAWQSIEQEQKMLNLDEFQRNQAQTKRGESDETVEARIKESFIWLMAPYQPDARDASSFGIQEWKLNGPEPLAVRASQKLKKEEALITDFSAIRLRMELDRYNLWGEEPHLPLQSLWDYFTRYPYLARLRDERVLAEAVQDGFSSASWADNFAYAQAWDRATGRYLNLKAGQPAGVTFDGHSLLVRPEAAAAQLAQERPAAPLPSAGPDAAPAPHSPASVREGNPTAPAPATAPEQRRFYGVVELDPLRLSRQVETIAQEVLQHLTSLMGANVRVTLEIHAELPNGVSEQVARTVSENARTLRFRDAAFEEE